MYHKIPEVLTRGHALNKDRITKLEERALFSKYVILPTKFGFKLSFRITMLVIKFISRCRKGKPFNGPKLSLPLEIVPKVLVQISLTFKRRPVVDVRVPTLGCSPGSLQPPSMENGFNQPATNLTSTSEMRNLGSMKEEDFYIRLAATYLFRTATMEVKHFNKKEYLDKIGFEHNGILYGKNRILEGIDFQNVSGMDMVNLNPLGVNTICPIVDR